MFGFKSKEEKALERGQLKDQRIIMSYCYNGGNRHNFRWIFEEQPVTINNKEGKNTFHFNGIPRKLDINKKTPIFCRCGWCGAIAKAEI